MGRSSLPRRNIVTSVNGNTGNVIVNRVALADNLYSPDNQEMFGDYIFRTSGGTTDINSGVAELLEIHGHTITLDEISLSAEITASGNLSATVDAEEFASSSLGGSSGDYLFEAEVYWLYQSAQVLLSTYGITILSPVENGVTATVVYTAASGGDEGSAAEATITMSDGSSPSIDASIFANSNLGGSSGTYVFTCVSNWTYQNQPVTINDYGISVSGTPVDGDTLDVDYTAFQRGMLRTATPASFKSVGLNQFNPQNVLSGYTIDTNGDVVVESGSYVAWIRAVPNLLQGYTVYSANSSIVRVAYNENIPTAGAEGLLVFESDPELNSGLLIDTDGYICVAATDTTYLCVHPTWSGYEDTTYELYSDTFVNIPTVDANGAALPTASYGIPSVGTVYDILSFSTNEYIQKIGHYSYSTENLAIVEEMGVEYIYDSTDIFYVLVNPVVYFLDSSVSNSYIAADFGTEEFISTEVTVPALHLYGDNLRDKIRRMTDIIYPVGSIYTSVSNVSPAILFGGTWERITGRFLLAATDNGRSGAAQAAGNTGGSATVTLTANQSGQRALSISGGGHTHTVRSNVQAGYQSGTNKKGYNAGGDTVGAFTPGITANTGTHTHTVAAAAASEAHENMPPYLSVYMWKRTA